jgi:YfiH family protein
MQLQLVIFKILPQLQNDMDEKRNALSVITPRWPAPSKVHAYTTTRSGGVSSPSYHSLNLASHVGDIPEAVKENRTLLHRSLSLPSEPTWLEQVHGNKIVDAANGSGQRGDASIAYEPGAVCTVLTADCLPLLLCDQRGTRVAAVHAGWRGLAAGIVENTIRALETPGEHLLAWLGPAIGPKAFEVGPEVKQIFIDQDSRNASAFSPHSQGRWLADIYQLARLRLMRLGVQSIYGGQHCTVTDSARFYSYRRDGETGRMATLIWLANSC